MVTNVGRLAGCLAIVLAAGCASFQRVPTPNWERYPQGELAGFLHAPGERVVTRVPEIAVRRARGRVESPFEPRRVKAGGRPAVSTPPDSSAPNADLADIDTTLFVVELRGPGSSSQVRTLASRIGEFDFGPLPNGTYTLKVISHRWPAIPGWEGMIRTVVVSEAAPASSVIRLYLDRLDPETANGTR